METAIEYLEGIFKQNYGKDFVYINKQIFDRAKEMHKAQIINAYMAGDINTLDYIAADATLLTPEEYYNKLYI